MDFGRAGGSITSGSLPYRLRSLFSPFNTPRRRSSQRSALRLPGKSISIAPSRMVRIPWPGTPGKDITIPSKTRNTPSRFLKRIAG